MPKIACFMQRSRFSEEKEANLFFPFICVFFAFYFIFLCHVFEGSGCVFWHALYFPAFKWIGIEFFLAGIIPGQNPPVGNLIIWLFYATLVSYMYDRAEGIGRNESFVAKNTSQPSFFYSAVLPSSILRFVFSDCWPQRQGVLPRSGFYLILGCEVGGWAAGPRGPPICPAQPEFF